MTRSRDVSAVQNNLGVAIPPAAAGKNAVINGGFDIWQRGTSISVAASSGTYTADRWYLSTGTNQASTLSRQATSDTTNLPNIQYCARVQRNSGQTGTGNITFSQSFETINSIPFAGKTVTFSFYARKGADYSQASSNLTIFLITGTGTDQNRGSANYTGEGYAVNGATATLTTTWQRFTYTGTVGATVTEMAAYFQFTPTGTAGTNDYYEITGVQIDLGSTALPFRTNGGTIQGELAACQRYYWRQNTENSFGYFAQGAFSSSTNAYVTVTNPVQMRTSPSSLDYSTLYVYDFNGSFAVTSAAISTAGSRVSFLALTIASGGTQYRPVLPRTESTGYIGLSAEL